VDVLFLFSQKKKYQKEKSQPGSVAMLVQWLGKTCGCRNITNAALGRGYFNIVADSGYSLYIKRCARWPDRNAGHASASCGEAFFCLDLLVHFGSSQKN
jgi:hypothetical protein